MKKVGIMMGSINDYEVLKPAFEFFDSMGVDYEAHVYSAHRTPDKAADFAKNARDNGFGVLIAAAGMAAHLAGAVAAQTTLPVIGIPVKSTALEGLDALLSTVQMPAGVPVATVAVNGSYNAAVLAVQILSLEDTEAQSILENMKKKMYDGVLEKDTQLQEKIRG